MSDTLGDRIRARRDARNAAARAIHADTAASDYAAVLAEVKSYVDQQLAALIERNNLK